MLILIKKCCNESTKMTMFLKPFSLHIKVAKRAARVVFNAETACRGRKITCLPLHDGGAHTL